MKKNELFNKLVKEKIVLRKRKDISEYKDKFETLSEFLTTANRINEEHVPRKDIRKNKYSEMHDDMKKLYWSKHSVQKLSRIKGAPNRNTDMSYNYQSFYNLTEGHK